MNANGTIYHIERLDLPHAVKYRRYVNMKNIASSKNTKRIPPTPVDSLPNYHNDLPSQMMQDVPSGHLEELPKILQLDILDLYIQIM